MEKIQIQDPGSRMNIPYLMFKNLVAVCVVKNYLNSFMRMRIRDLVNPGTGMKKIGSGINIPYPQHCFSSSDILHGAIN
jgi:hypothetical protein